MFKYLLICLFPIIGFSQVINLYRINNLPVKENGKMKLHAFSGGLNDVSFSQFDFNKDGLLDLYVYDNQSNKSLVYLHKLNGIDHQYVNDYSYENIFPNDLSLWALLRDYNCDNVTDLFSYEGITVKVYKGKMVNNRLSFTLNNIFLTAEDTGTSTNRVQVYTCGMPIIEDVNKDGYLDIMSVQSLFTGNTNITYMKNMGLTNGLHCDSFKLKVISNCWGKLKFELPLSFKLNQCGGVLKDGMSLPYNKGNLRHCGSVSAWVFDNDNDGDYDLCAGEEFSDYTIYGRNAGHKDFGNIDTSIVNFPNYDVPIPYYLSQGSWMDIDNDNIKDLLVTTLVKSDMIDDYLDREHISFYKNTPVGNNSSFKLQENNFLVGNSIDVGHNAFPVLFDYNGDSLTDLLISNEKYYINDSVSSACIFLYKNIGTKKAPSFELISTDFASLRKLKLKRIVPTFGDLDGDGDFDMMFGDEKTGLHIAINHPIGGIANFDSVKLNYISLGAFNVNASPFLFDINQDGKIDLLLGENNGLVYLMKNKGTINNAIFDTIGMNRNLGKMSAQDSVLGYFYDLKPTITIDGKFIYLGNRLGNIFKFEWHKDSIDKGSFKRHSTSYIPYNSGNYASIAVGDINGDGKSEFLIGNIRGGLQLYSTTVFENALEKDIDTLIVKNFSVGINDLSQQKDIIIYPNPTNDKLFVNGLNEFTDIIFSIYNPLMQIVKSGVLIEEVIDVKSLENGQYFINLKNKNLMMMKQFIKFNP